MNTLHADDEPDIEEAIARLSRMMRRLQGGASHHFPGGQRLLEIVLADDGIRASELAQRLNIRPSSLTDALNRMEHHGLIERRRDEEDSRVTRVHVTEKGMQRFQEHKPPHEAWSKTLNGCITQQEKEQFCALSEKIIAFLEQQPGGEQFYDDRHKRSRGGE